MNANLKLILGIFAGMLVFILCVAVIQFAGHALIPPPENASIATPEELAAYLSERPVALVPVLLGYVLGSLAGGFAAARIAGPRAMPAAVAIGVLGMVANFFNLQAIPHPLWFVIVSFLIFVPMAWLGGRLAAGRAA